jgi:N-acetyl-gamma-glutamyl-phosphate/LysW-gamma-L-alpha-aminoadipyl-6-phosphate reductase
MSIRAGILGASGYGGGELLRLLSAHPKVGEIQAMSRRHADLPISTVHPNLRGIFDQNFVGKVEWEWLNDSDTPVLFAAIPHGEFGGRYCQFAEEWKAIGLDQKLTVIDLSADFRISDPDLYKKHYKSEHPCPDRLAEWVYGFPELQPERIKGTRRIANPGCFATSLELGLMPIRHLDIPFIAASGATGSSGSGMEPSDTTHHPTRSNDFRAYKILSHQHMGEVTQLLGDSKIQVGFVPHSAPIVRGILTTLLFQLPEDLTGNDLKALYEKAYKDAKFIRFVDGSPRVAAVAGSNFADIGIVTQGNQAAVLVALDNLLKGMAGQAVQNMNLALGFEETEGLWFVGGYPY